MGKNVIISTLPNISQNYLPKVNTSNIFANSLVYDNGTNVMVNTTATHADYTNARLVVNNTGNSYLEVRGNGGQGTIALTTSTSTTSNFPTVEIFNSADFGIVGYRPGVVSSNYIMYYELSSSTNRRLTFQTEGQNRLIINQNGTAQFTQALTGTSATFASGGNRNVLISNDSVDTGYSIISLNGTRTKGSYAGIAGGGTGDDNLYINSGSSVVIQTGASYTSRLTISSTGAATFSSSAAGYGITLNHTSENLRLKMGAIAGGIINIQGEVISSGGVYPIVLNYLGGNVGIGTASPANILSISASTNSGSGSTYPLTSISNTLATQGDGSTTFNFAGLLVQSGNGAVQFYHSTSYAAGTWEPQALLNVATNHPLIIRTNNTERMRITSGGNVLIGGTVVQNSSANRGNLTINGTTSILNLSTSDTNAGYLYHGGTDMLLVNAKNGATLFYTNDTERMRITSGGTAWFQGGNVDDVNTTAIRVDNRKFLSFYNAAANGWAFSLASDSSNNGVLGANVNMIFNTGSSFTERMRITSGGRVIINNSVPNDSGDRNLTIQGSLSANNQDVASINLTQVWNGVSYPAIVAAQIGDSVGVASSKMVFKTTAWNGSAAITSLRMTITENGNIGAPSGSNIYNASDLRLKKNISSITDGLNKVLNLNPVMFNWVDDFVKEENGKDMLGFIAQEVQEIIPQAVEDFGSNTIAIGETIVKNPLRVNEKFIIPVLVKAIQELKAENDQQKADIESLKALINK